MMKPVSPLDVIRATRAHFNGLHSENFDTGMREEDITPDDLARDIADYLNMCIAEHQSAVAVFSRVREAILAHAANALDPEWYLERYSDVVIAGEGAEQHYHSDGRKEGRFPNALAEKIASLSLYFDDQWYLERYGDVAEARIDPRRHFAEHGRQEGRFPNRLVEKRRGLPEWFDAEWYVNRYLDVAQSRQDPREHYVKYGATEGRHPNAAAENNFRSEIDDFVEFISGLKKNSSGQSVDYFEYLAWLRFYKLGLTKKEIRQIVLWPLT